MSKKKTDAKPVSIESFKIRVYYDGSFEAMKLDTFIKSQNSLVKAMKAIAEIIAPGISIEARIVTVREGSCDVETCIVLGTAAFLQNPIEAFNVIWKTTKDSIELLKVLAGSVPKSVTPLENDMVKIVNNQGQNHIVTQNVYNVVMNNTTIQGSFFDFGKALNSDGEVSDVSMTSESVPDEPLELTKPDFASLGKKLPTDVKQTEETVNEATLYLKKVEVIPEEHSRWDFITHDGNVLSSVSINDAVFLERVRSEKTRFGAGDRLRAVLRTHYKRGPSDPVPVVSGHSIDEVLEHEPREEAQIGIGI